MSIIKNAEWRFLFGLEKFGWRYAELLSENLPEIAWIIESDCRGDLGNADLFILVQRNGAVYPVLIEIFDKAALEIFTEFVAKMGTVISVFPANVRCGD